MMECSLKFVTSPSNATLNDLLLIDSCLDSHWGKEDELKDCFQASIYGFDLYKTAKCIAVVRQSSRELKAVNQADLYRKCLIILTSSLASIPSLLNRVYLFHSLAYHVSKLGN